MRRCIASAVILVSLAGIVAHGAVQQARLEFLRNDQPWLANADGTGRQRSAFPGYGYWSPDGARVAYVTSGRRRSRVYVARADGSQRSVVASVNPIDECFSADWSPRGTQLVFRTGCDNDFTSLYVVRGNGTGLRRLARDFWTLGPTWSPDGGSILFAGSPPGHRGSFALFLTDACGRKPLRIPGLWFNWYPSTDWAWAREGRRVFVLLDTSHTNRGLELSVLGRRGGRLHQLTPPDIDVGAFEVSPDDGRIVLQAAIGSRDWEIYVMRSDGTGLTPLTDNRSQDRDPHWSADGKRILFTSERDGNSEIYVMNDDGSSQTNLTRDPARDDSPSWIP